MSSAESRAARLWERVDALIDRASTPSDLRSHRLELLAARRFRGAEKPVPAEFAVEEKLSAINSMATPVMLERIADTLDRPAVVMKGPEVATFYPDPSLRGYGDIDLLVEDAQGAQEALLRAGFEPVGDPSLYVDLHHLRPLTTKGLPIWLEIHSEPKWVDGLRAPSAADVLEGAVSGSSAIPGLLKPTPEQHALILASHSWAHEPLRRLRDIVDIAAVVVHADRAEIGRLAEVWNIERVWQTTIAAVDALFFDGRPPRVFQVWAQNLDRVRERTVFEHHLERWLSDFWALPTSAALRRVPATLRNEVRPDGAEGWSAKLARSRLALRNAFRRRSDHEQEWERRGVGRGPDE